MAKTRRTGFIMTELTVSAGLLGLILAGLAVSMHGFSMMNHYQWARQRCVAAAEAQLDSLAATGVLIDEAQLKRLWPEVDVSVERTAGDATWDGLDLVRVTAIATTGSRSVTVHLERYFPKDF